MKILPPCFLHLAAFAGIVFPGSAAVVTFNLVPAQSTITISGSIATAFGTAVFQEQGPGSLTTRFTGSLNADVTASSIEFKAGSVIDAATNGIWAPLAGGANGTAIADFGAQSSLLGGAVSAAAALRNILFDATSPGIAVSAGSFNSASLIFQFPTNGTSAFDYRVTGLAATSGAKKFETLATNQVTTAGTLVDQNGTQTLTIPVNASFKFTLLGPDDTTVTLKGSLVATRSSAPTVVFNGGSITINGSAIALQWQAPAGQTFRIEGSTNLVDWSNRVSNITSANTTYSWSGTAIGPTEYFRLAQ